MRNLMIIISLCVCSSVFSQNMEKAYFENNPHLGGDVTIKSANLEAVGEEIHKTFEIESLQDGAYYVIQITVGSKKSSRKISI